MTANKVEVPNRGKHNSGQTIGGCADVTVPVVTVAIVTYCSRIELPACLDSLLESDIPIKIVVIDNGSSDGTLELAQDYACRFNHVLAVASGGNIGLAAGNNIVIPYIEGDYALMLNPDTVVKPDTISKLVRLMDGDPKLGVVGPKCVYEDGRPHTSYHRGWNYWHLFIWRVIPYSVTRRLYDKFARYREIEVDFVSGACLLVRSQLFRDVGGYDPAYFLTVEDVCDLCRRIHKLGYKILFTPRAEITHLCGRSGAQVPYLSTLEAYKGDVYHFAKHHGNAGGYLAFAVVVFACFTKILVSLLKFWVMRRKLDAVNLGVYRRVLPELLANGPNIAYSTEH
jgi:GT2 family glycosyltransferase